MELSEQMLNEKIDARLQACPGSDIPENPEAKDWKRRAHLKWLLAKSPMAITAHQKAFVAGMDALAMLPPYRKSAQEALRDNDRARRAELIAYLNAELSRVDVTAWGLPPKAVKQIEALLSGTAAPTPGPGIPIFNPEDLWGSLRVEHGTLAVEGVKQDAMRRRDLQRQLDAAEAEQASSMTEDEAAIVERERRIKAAKGKPAKVETPKEQDFDKATYAAGRKLARDMAGASQPLK